MTLVVFKPVTHCDFLNYDDPDYFSANQRVLTGLSSANLAWAFTTGHASNWHPLTWLSLMLDADLFGKNPLGPHFTNMVLHAANTVLLFLLLWFLTKSTWRGAVVAALFALHPLHVESVAWVAERKDVLSAFFGLLALLAYAKAVTSGRQDAPPVTPLPRQTYYWLSLLFFALGLMSKPMLVTLPFVLLLLDWWPLNRVSTGRFRMAGLKPLVCEKIPFFALSMTACVVTFIAQQKGGAVTAMAKFPLPARMENAAVSYLRYLVKAFWPEPLAIPYPHPGHWPAALVLVSTGLFVVLCMGAFWSARKFPFALTGWFWFAGMLVPVIGLVQVGDASMADRYTYLPLVGIFIVVVWGVAEMCGQLRIPKPPVFFATVLILAACGLQSRNQLKFWQNSGMLFRHTLAVTDNNYVAENDLGTWLSANGQVAEAIDCFRRSLRINPDNSPALHNLGNASARLGRWDDAIDDYRHALQLNPKRADTLDNLGVALAAKQEFAEAFTNYEAALKLKPDFADAHNNLGALLFRSGNYPAAAEHFYEACRLEPNRPQFCANLGDALVKLGNIKAATECYRLALQMEPDNQKFKTRLQSVEGQPSN